MKVTGLSLRLPHQINIITNIDKEHLDYYKSKKKLLLWLLKILFQIYLFMVIQYYVLDNEDLNKLSKKMKTRKTNHLFYW